MKIEQIDPAKLLAADYNPRQIDAHQLEALKRSIGRWGFVEPVIVNKRSGTIVGGHQRTKAALELALDVVPVTYVDLDDDAEKALNIALNKIAGDWDEDKLAELLADLEKGGQDLEDLGFETDELDVLLKSLEGEAVELEGDLDEVPEPPAVPITQPGDLWQLGKHRLLCGDSTSADDVAKLMDGAKADLCFTSPPYGQQRDYDEASDVSDWDGLMQGVFGAMADAMAPDGQVLVNLGLIHDKGEWMPYWDGWIAWMRGEGWKRFGFYVWDKGYCAPAANNGRLRTTHEFIFHFCRTPKPAVEYVPNKTAGKKQHSGNRRTKSGEMTYKYDREIKASRRGDAVFRCLPSIGSIGHPAPFSVDLAAEAIRSWPGVIFEPFSGSGTTILAAEQEGSKAYAMEISPAYCDVAVLRFEKATGNKAERIAAVKEA